MEAAGLVLGVIALAGACKDCLELFACISAARSLGQDYEILETKLDIEKALLLQWAHRVRLLDANPDSRLEDPSAQTIIFRTLSRIKLLLSESDKLRLKYGLQEKEGYDKTQDDIEDAPEGRGSLVAPAGQRGNQTGSESAVHSMTPAGEGRAKASSIMSGNRMDKFVQQFRAMNIRINDRHHKISTIGKTRWVINDRDKFERLIRDLSYLISKLNHLIPAKIGQMESMVKDDLDIIENPNGLRLILEASAGTEPRIAQQAKLANQRLKEELCRQRILNCLWHRRLTHRELSLDDAHFKTLNWALKPPEGALQWDDLSHWLQSESGLYWICGKAGSGKSTLMKFLHGHEEANKRLQAWAGPHSLTVGSFFFWNLGTEEQKTHRGLLRGLLYDVLLSDPAVTQELLPDLWREAETINENVLEVPSRTELEHAFKLLAERPSTDRKYFFWIDGLDEYAGDVKNGVTFIARLSRNPAIKCLVSSRPVPACVEVFHNSPSLQMQDLTRDDIAMYVSDKVG